MDVEDTIPITRTEALNMLQEQSSPLSNLDLEDRINLRFADEQTYYRIEE